jgi:polyisoprenoid-binding protein YceI
MKKLNYTNLMILTLLVCLSFGCIFGSKEKTPIISPPTATPIPTAIPITNIQENTSLSITKSEDSIPKTNPGILKITLTNESTARYKIQEQLVNRNLPNYAIGETNSVEGELYIDTKNNSIHKNSTIEVNLTTLKSDSSRRDRYLKTRSLESSKYPTAKFTTDAVQGSEWLATLNCIYSSINRLPPSLEDIETKERTIIEKNCFQNQPIPNTGQDEFKLNGSLTVRDVTKPISWNVKATWTGTTNITGTASTKFTFDYFNITKPSVSIVLGVADDIRLELDFVATINVIPK